MTHQLRLHSKLKEICDNVYFQPPAKMVLKYPCFVYQLSDMIPGKSVMGLHHLSHEYTVKYITTSVTDLTINEVMKIDYVRMERHYVEDNIYHYIYKIQI